MGIFPSTVNQALDCWDNIQNNQDAALDWLEYLVLNWNLRPDYNTVRQGWQLDQSLAWRLGLLVVSVINIYALLNGPTFLTTKLGMY